MFTRIKSTRPTLCGRRLRSTCLLLGLLVTLPPAGAHGSDPAPGFVVPQIDAAPGSLVFGSGAVGATSAAQLVVVSNNGSEPMRLGVLSLPVGYLRSGGSCGDTVEAGSNCTIAISFRPMFPGHAEGGLVIISDRGSQSVLLSGTGTAAEMGSPGAASDGNHGGAIRVSNPGGEGGGIGRRL